MQKLSVAMFVNYLELLYTWVFYKITKVYDTHVND